MKLITIAKVGAPHGVHGFLKLNVFTEPVDNIEHYQDWYIFLKNQWQPLARFELQQKGDGYHIRINDIHDRDEARQFTNALIGVPREALPDINNEDEFYWSDLEGLTVINKQGVELGKVEHLFEVGPTDVMKVVGKQQHFIPFIKQYIIKVDLKARTVRVDWEEDFS